MDWKKRLKPGTPPMKDVLAPAALVFEITERITSQKDLFNLDHSDGSRSLEITVTLAEALTARYQRRQQPGEDEWIMVNAEVLAHLMTVNGGLRCSHARNKRKEETKYEPVDHRSPTLMKRWLERPFVPMRDTVYMPSDQS